MAAAPHPDGRGRVIRVFVSSTFRDMVQEREELVKRVFPKLRKLCESRGVTWSEVDLRWGITEDQAEKGEVLPRCLAEIERSRPYFIGLLGERYGWVPDEIPERIVTQQPWLAEHLDRSVTELEILHGVLNKPEMAEHAYFYFRDPVYFQSVAGSDGECFSETDPERIRKLAGLKERIRASALRVSENYTDTRALGNLVLQDFTALIDEIYPEDSTPGPLEREAEEHEAYARSHAGAYVESSWYYHCLDVHARGDGPPLVVLGESGSGKSALLANWALLHRAAHPENLVLMHFIGGSATGSDWRSMARRIITELSRRLELPGEIPDDSDELRLALAATLHAAAAKCRVVLVLDALDRLEDAEGAPDLLWLPSELPPNLRLVLSTLPGRPLDEVRERGWPTLVVTPLDPPEREELITRYLAEYAKELAPERVRHIAAAPQVANPLFLRALLGELRVFGDHDRLQERIDHYLAAATTTDLFQKILGRYEEDYEHDRPGLVRDAMTLVWAARRGLSEAELLDLLGRDGRPLPAAFWSPLHLAAERALAGRFGYLTFSNDFMRQAVRERYLSTGRERTQAHLRLAGYFQRDDLSFRAVDELPWHLVQACAWERLYDQMADPDFLQAAWLTDRYEVQAYWARIGESSPLLLTSAYQPVLQQPERYSEPVIHIVSTLLQPEHLEEARRLQTHLVDRFSGSHERDQRASAMSSLALILRDMGRYDDALGVQERHLLLCQALGDTARAATSLNNLGTIYNHLGKPIRAMRCFKECEQLFARQDGPFAREGLAASLGNQASILVDQGDLDGALALLSQSELIHRSLDARLKLAGTLHNETEILWLKGQFDPVVEISREVERVARELGDRRMLQRALFERLMAFHQLGKRDEALALLPEAERVCRALGDRQMLEGCAALRT